MASCGRAAGTSPLSSEVGRGTVFHIYLPVAVAPAVPTAKQAAGPKIDSGGTETILLAEDKDDIPRLRHTAPLQSSGYKVLEACNGEDALRLHERVADDIHLLITDTVMARMNRRRTGPAVETQTCRPQGALHVGVYRQFAERAATDAEVAAPFLQKPFTSKTLLAKGAEVLCGAGR